MINFAISPADLQDRDMIAPLLAIAKRRSPTLQAAVADGGYLGPATAAAVFEAAALPLAIVKRSETAKGFEVLPKRWIVERTFGWLGRCRRLARDYENKARTSAAFFILAMIRVMVRRIARILK